MENEVVVLANVRHMYREKPTLLGRKLSARQLKSHGSVDIIQVLSGELPNVSTVNFPVWFNTDKIPVFLHKGISVQLKGVLEPLTKRLYRLVVSQYMIRSQTAENTVRSKVQIDPQQVRNEAVNSGGFTMDDLPIPLPDPLVTPEIQKCQEFLQQLNLPFDLEMAYNIQLFFQRRAKKRNVEILTLLKKNPLMLADMPEKNFTFSRIEKAMLGAHIEIPPEVSLYMEMASILHRAAQNGNSCYPVSTIAYELRERLNALHIPKKEQNHYLAQLATNDQGVLPSISASKIITSSQELASQKAAVKDYYLKAYTAANIDNPENKTWGLSLVFYLTKSFFSERSAADLFRSRLGKLPMDSYLAEIPALPGLQTQQKEALNTAFTHKVSVLTGGGGTGKTYVVKILVDLLRKHNEKAIILAPSAMAAIVAAKRTDFSAEYMTIHRFAKILPQDEDLGENGDIIINNEDSAMAGLRFLIIDEISMCTLPMFARVLNVIKNYPNLRLLLVGDPAQLPAIGPQFFHHIADGLLGDLCPVTNLTINMRAKGSAGAVITKFAEDIRHGEFKVPRNKAVTLYSGTIKTFQKDYPVLSNSDVLVLTNTRMEVSRLTPWLRKLQGLATEPIEGTPFYINDPIVSIQNDYADNTERQFTAYRHPMRDCNVFNGTNGFIEKVAGNTIFLRLFLPDCAKNGKLVPYQKEELFLYFEPAYAMTVNKAQGGERDIVVFAMDSTHTHISQNMLYTAVTRAQKAIYLIGNEASFKDAAAHPVKPALTKFAFRILKEAAPAKSSSVADDCTMMEI